MGQFDPLTPEQAKELARRTLIQVLLKSKNPPLTIEQVREIINKQPKPNDHV